MWKFRAHLFDRNGERIELTRGPPAQIYRSVWQAWVVCKGMHEYRCIQEIFKLFDNCGR